MYRSSLSLNYRLLASYCYMYRSSLSLDYRLLASYCYVDLTRSSPSPDYRLLASYCYMDPFKSSHDIILCLSLYPSPSSPSLYLSFLSSIFLPLFLYFSPPPPHPSPPFSLQAAHHPHLHFCPFLLIDFFFKTLA